MISMTMPESEHSFLDVQRLLASSEPEGRWGGWRPMLGVFAIATLVAWLTVGQRGNESVSIALTIALIGLVIAWSSGGYFTGRAIRNEQLALEGMEEMIQLRRWPEAAIMAQGFLSRPARTHPGRAQALLFLSMILARYHRFEDSLAVHEYILDEIPMDDVARHMVQLGRAMMLLRDENLLEADRAISELRKGSREQGGSPGLTLVEIYRDVKTGHHAEAIEMFESRLPILRKQLSHRLADAWALAAKAYDMLSRPEQAASAYQNATLLMPLGELRRKYPEIGSLGEKFAPAAAPPEVR